MISPRPLELRSPGMLTDEFLSHPHNTATYHTVQDPRDRISGQARITALRTKPSSGHGVVDVTYWQSFANTAATSGKVEIGHECTWSVYVRCHWLKHINNLS